MISSTLFYILSVILVLSSIIAVISNRLILSGFAIICILFSTGILFLVINSNITGIFQIILSIFITVLLTVLYKNKLIENKEENLFKTGKFWMGVIIFSAIILLILLFTNYYITVSAIENFIIYDKKAFVEAPLSIFITAKSIFKDYFLAYIYSIILLFVSFGGVRLLLKNKDVSAAGDKND